MMSVASLSVQNEIEAADDEHIRGKTELDFDALDRIIAEDLVYVHSSGKIDSKASLMESVRARKVRYRRINRTDVIVRAFGDFALLHCKVVIDVESGGPMRTVNCIIVSAWVKRNARWQMVHYHAAALAQK